MTEREFLTAVTEIANVAEDIKSEALARIEKLNKKNKKRSSTPSKTALANQPIKAEIANLLTTDTPLFASDVAKALNLSSVQKASALLVQLTADGVAESLDRKVKGKGVVKGYVLADDTNTEGEE